MDLRGRRSRRIVLTLTAPTDARSVIRTYTWEVLHFRDVPFERDVKLLVHDNFLDFLNA